MTRSLFKIPEFAGNGHHPTGRECRVRAAGEAADTDVRRRSHTRFRLGGNFIRGLLRPFFGEFWGTLIDSTLENNFMWTILSF